MDNIFFEESFSTIFYIPDDGYRKCVWFLTDGNVRLFWLELFVFTGHYNSCSSINNPFFPTSRIQTFCVHVHIWYFSLIPYSRVSMTSPCLRINHGRKSYSIPFCMSVDEDPQTDVCGYTHLSASVAPLADPQIPYRIHIINPFASCSVRHNPHIRLVRSRVLLSFFFFF